MQSYEGLSKLWWSSLFGHRNFPCESLLMGVIKACLTPPLDNGIVLASVLYCKCVVVGSEDSVDLAVA